MGIKRRYTAIEKSLPSDVVETLHTEIPLKKANQKSGQPQKRIKRPPVKSFQLVAFDLETTGLDESNCEIIEIGAVKFDLEGTTHDTFQRFAKPSGRIPQFIVEKTGITDAMVAGAPSPWSAVREFSYWAGKNATLVAHNAPFDIKFLVAAFKNAGENPPSWTVIDTLEWARRDRLNVRNNKLQTLLKFIRKDTSTAHRALADAQGAAHLLVYLASKRKNTSLAVTRRIVDLDDMTCPPASERQLDYLRALGASESELVDIDRDRASRLIDEYKARGEIKGKVKGHGCRNAVVALFVVLIALYLIMC